MIEEALNIIKDVFNNNKKIHGKQIRDQLLLLEWESSDVIEESFSGKMEFKLSLKAVVALWRPY